MSWVATKVIERRVWDEHAWSLTVSHTLTDQRPGQWINLALGEGAERLRRPYSIASAPGAPLEFLLAKVEGGALSPRLHALDVGDEVWVEDTAHGFFTLDDVPPAKCLWMLATGTGLGPFMAMLRTRDALHPFQHITLVHCVRQAAQLAYRDTLASMQAANSSAPTFSYLPLVTRQQVATIRRARITTLLRDGELSAAAGAAASLAAEDAHLMLCGNPAMVSEATALLKERGLRKHRRRKPGHITTETYW